MSFLYLALSLFLLIGPASAQSPIQVVTTTTALCALTQVVGGSRVELISLVPGEMDAEEYQPKPKDVLHLKDARLFVRVGLDFDLWADRLLAQAENREISRGAAGYVDASYGVAVLELRGMSVGPSDGHAHGSGNPHYWLDPRNAEIMTANILEGLSRVDPAHAAQYEANRSEFVRRLSEKITEWQAYLQPFKGIPVVAYHNSWPYFARRFGIDFIGFIETKPGVPPTASHLAALIRTMRSRSVRLVVREPQEPERDVNFLADRVGGSVITMATSVGGLPGTNDYVSMFDTDIAAFLTAAKQR
jgi:ABC-type Zn uptake system ZnuABC Zn-binding protein ZnuA